MHNSSNNNALLKLNDHVMMIKTSRSVSNKEMRNGLITVVCQGKPIHLSFH